MPDESQTNSPHPQQVASPLPDVESQLPVLAYATPQKRLSAGKRVGLWMLTISRRLVAVLGMVLISLGISLYILAGESPLPVLAYATPQSQLSDVKRVWLRMLTISGRLVVVLGMVLISLGISLIIMDMVQSVRSGGMVWGGIICIGIGLGVLIGGWILATRSDARLDRAKRQYAR